MLGAAVGEQKEVRALNRVLRWTGTGIEYDTDPRHQEIIVRELYLTIAKGLSSPGVNGAP